MSMSVVLELVNSYRQFYELTSDKYREYIDADIAENARVCHADKLLNDYIIKTVKTAWPNVLIVSEESEITNNIGYSHVCIIDPIDGTNNYHDGSKHWGISVAVYRRQPNYLTHDMIWVYYESMIIFPDLVVGLVRHDGPLTHINQSTDLAVNNKITVSRPYQTIFLSESVGSDMAYYMFVEDSGLRAKDLGLSNTGLRICRLRCSTLAVYNLIMGIRGVYLSTKAHVWDIAASLPIAVKYGCKVLIKQNDGDDTLRLSDDWVPYNDQMLDWTKTYSVLVISV